MATRLRPATRSRPVPAQFAVAVLLLVVASLTNSVAGEHLQHMCHVSVLTQHPYSVFIEGKQQQAKPHEHLVSTCVWGATPLTRPTTS